MILSLKSNTAMLLLSGIFLTSCGASRSNGTQNGLINTPNISEDQAELIFEHASAFPSETELAIGIIKKGAIQYVGVRRTRDSLMQVENSRKVFEIGSITKVFTATLLSCFVEQGEIELDEPIQDHIGFKVRDGQSITFQQLANHTSGLPRLPPNLNLSSASMSNPYKSYNEDKLEELFRQGIALKSEPGTAHEYSNFGAGILGFALEHRSKGSYEELLQAKVFSKYDMIQSTTLRNTVENDLVYGLDANGEITLNWDFDLLVGAGGVLSSVEDLVKFSMAHFGPENEELTRTRQPTFVVNDKTSVGLGWFIIEREGKRLTWHNG